MKHSRKYSSWSRRIERNILSVYHRANESDRAEGLHWYANANKDICLIAQKHKVDFSTAIGVVAVLSPGQEWGRNLLEADMFIEAWQAGYRGRKLPIVGVYGNGNVRKAIRILEGEAPLDVMPKETSPKVRAFYSAILDPTSSRDVCIDRHAKCLAFNIREGRDRGGIVRPAEFKYLAWHYQRIAEGLGLLPHQLQAVTWVTWRRLKGQLEQSDLPF